jgi:ubiquinone biosynthesis protein COQ9
VSLLRLSPSVAASLGWMLEAAGIPAGGLAGGMRINALGLVYANTLRVWLDDDTADMARTMAAVDRGLGRLEQAARLFPARARHDAFVAPPPAAVVL